MTPSRSRSFPLPIDGANRAAIAGALAPHWGALLVLALFLIAGLSVLDDYGVTFDEFPNRDTAMRNIRHIMGEPGSLPSSHDKFYGVVSEAPLLLAENAFGIEHWRGIHISRHLLTHLFFLFGGLFAYLLSYRLFGSRLIALFAMAIFLLHPRLYGHSFYNSKDISFFAMFVIALYLTYVAFKRRGIPAFVLLGSAVGILVNIRVMGAILPAGILAMQAIDFVRAEGWAERKRVLAAAGAFALAAALTTYAPLPYLWSDPLGRVIEWWTTLSNHPANPHEIFRGTMYRSQDFPREYLPVWISITAPPFAALLGATGIVVILARGVGSIEQATRNGRTRFALLLAGCVILPVLWVVVAGANVYNGWRHMYFLWAPFSLLMAYGLWALVGALGRARLRAATLGAAGAGLSATLVSMALIHPNEQVYFNFLVDRTTSEHLRTQYPMDYWGNSVRQTWERLLDANPSETVSVNGMEYYYGTVLLERTMGILPEASRRRASTAASPDALAFAYSYGAFRTRRESPVHRVRLYNNTIATAYRKDDISAIYEEAASDPGRVVWRVAHSEDGSADYGLARSGLRVYVKDNSLAYVRDSCSSTELAPHHFFARLFPESPDDLPEPWRPYGFEELHDMHFPGHGAEVGGKCVASFRLPDYPLAGFTAIEYVPLSGDVWSAGFKRLPNEPGEGEDRAEHGLLRGSAFDLSLVDGTLAYVKEPCVEADTEHRFRLHIEPERASDLPEERRRHGFDNWDFDFADRGVLRDGKCVASVELPDYPIAGLSTGQFASIEEDEWADIWVAAFKGPRLDLLRRLRSGDAR